MMRVLMVGVDRSTKGGMWTVAQNFLDDDEFCRKTNLKYIATSVTGSKIKRIFFTVCSFVKIVQELSSKKYDIVHIHMSERGSVYRKNIVICIAQFFHCKVVLHMHGAEFEVWYKNSAAKTQRFVRKVVNRVDKVLILGEYWTEFMQSLMTDASKIIVLYNAVEVPVENKYNNNACNLLFLGIICKRKGIDDLLQAMNQIRDKLKKNIKLWLYGPDFENIIINKINELNLRDLVEYRGWLGNDKKEKIFSEIAVNILPSYNEGLPMTILETMAYGIPNITTNIAAIPEVVNSENGVVIEPGDISSLANAILSLVNDDSLRKKKSNAAYMTAKSKFSIYEQMSQVEKIYKEL